MKKALALAGAASVLTLTAYVLVWAAIDEMRWERPEYVWWPILMAVLVLERVRWLLPVATRRRVAARTSGYDKPVTAARLMEGPDVRPAEHVRRRPAPVR